MRNSGDFGAEPKAAAESPRYERDVELPSAMVTCNVCEHDGKVRLTFWNEHADYSVEITGREAAELRATIHAAESNV